MSLVTNLEVEVYGVAIENLYDYSAVSPLFVIGPLPEGNVLQLFGYDAPVGSSGIAAANGYYLMLA